MENNAKSNETIIQRIRRIIEEVNREVSPAEELPQVTDEDEEYMNQVMASDSGE